MSVWLGELALIILRLSSTKKIHFFKIVAEEERFELPQYPFMALFDTLENIRKLMKNISFTY